MNSSIINQKAISLYKGNVETFQYYALQEVIQVDYYDQFGKRQKIRVSIDKDPLTLNTRKTKHYWHFKDSSILSSVEGLARPVLRPYAGEGHRPA